MPNKKILLFVAFLVVTGVTTLSPYVYAEALDGGRNGMSETQKKNVTERKTRIQEKISTLKEERSTKLEAKRLETCQARQQKINDIFNKSTEQNKKQLAVFQKIEANIKQFYIDKKLSIPQYQAVLDSVATKEAIAVASIEVSSEITFDCTTENAAKPGAVIKEVMTTRHNALKEYRTAIKNLILVVRKANGTQNTTNSTTPTSNETKEQ